VIDPIRNDILARLEELRAGIEKLSRATATKVLGAVSSNRRSAAGELASAIARGGRPRPTPSERIKPGEGIKCERGYRPGAWPAAAIDSAR
jgi:hypothetical protein